MTTVLILAAGEQARWEDDMGIKQLLPVEQESVISRIQRQVRDRGFAAFVVTHHPQIIKVSKRTIMPRERRWTAETLRSTAYMWTSRVIVLLGDVVYSKAVMDSIINYDGAVRFWGNLHEIFALNFNDEAMTKMFTAIDKAIHHAEFQGGPGKLRKDYQACVGVDIEDNNIRQPYFEEDLPPDNTKDFDTTGEWKAFVLEVLNTWKLDDLPERVGI